MSDTASGRGMYSPRLAARIGRIKYQSFQAWAKANLIHAEKKPIGDRKTESIYSFYDLLLIRLIVRLKAEGARPREIRAALDTIDMLYEREPHAWRKVILMFSKEANVIVVVTPDKPDWNPLAASRGPQKLAVVFFPDLTKELQDELAPPDKFPHVEIDPEILGGVPVIKGTRISTRAVATCAVEDVRKAYPKLTEEQIKNAQDYEKFLTAA